MNKILMGLVIICLIGSVLYKKWASSYTLKKLYQLRAAGDSEQFIRAVDSDFASFHFSAFTRGFMKLNYWIGLENDREVEALVPALEAVKSTPRDKIALYSKLFGYALQRGRSDEAVRYQKELEQLLKNRTDRQSAAMRREVRQLDQIYLKRDVSVIPELEESLAGADGETEAVVCYRLAKLYYAKGDENRVAEYLQRAYRRTAGVQSRRHLEQAISDHSILK